MPELQLYNSLNKGLKKADMSVTEKKKLITNIDSLDQTGIDLMYVLIKYHEIVSNEVYTSVESETNRISWNLAHFPKCLRHILLKFTELHLTSMASDEARDKGVVV